MAAEGPARDEVVAVVGDLQGQLRGALEAGWTAAEIERALATVGIAPSTASALIRHIRGLGTIEVKFDDEVMLHLGALCATVREPSDRLRITDRRIAQLAAALCAAGLDDGLARAAARQIGQQERGAARVQARRMRRLGIQGMAGGTAFALFFGLSAVLIRGSGWWHLFPASFAAAIAAYAWYLYLRAMALLHD